MVDNGLVTFTVELRTRLERGDLSDHPPIRLDAALTLLNVEKAARSMLNEIDSYRSMPQAQRRAPFHLARQRELARQLRLLRDRLAGIPWDPAELARPRAF